MNAFQPLSVEQGSATNSCLDRDSSTNLEFASFGGLRALRRKSGFKVIRVLDPFERRFLSFPSPLSQENWLLRSFTSCGECILPSDSLRVLHKGQLLSAKPSLIVRLQQQRLADIVITELNAGGEERWSKFQLIARAHGYTPALRLARDIRSNILFLNNLELMRQHLGHYLLQSSDNQILEMIEHHLQGGRKFFLHDMCAALMSKKYIPQVIECVALELYRRKVVRLNVTEENYGIRTTIELL